MRIMIFYVGLNFTLKNVTKLRHCWKASNNQLLVKLGWALQGCANLPKNVHSNATCLQHMHSASYFTSFSSCMYPFFPLNLNLAKCLQNKKRKPKKNKKMLISKTYASNKRQGAYDDFFGIHTCRKFNMILDHAELRCIFVFWASLAPCDIF
jgi:hypothetical protein